MLVAFVCTGNICRSPMAEGLARAAGNSGDAEFTSAGTHALEGSPATAETRRVMSEAGIDVSAHRANSLADLMRRDPYVIYVMTDGQRRLVGVRHPELADRIRLLDPEGRDVDDPYGRDVETYRAALEHIEAAVIARAPDWR